MAPINGYSAMVLPCTRTGHDKPEFPHPYVGLSDRVGVDVTRHAAGPQRQCGPLRPEPRGRIRSAKASILSGAPVISKMKEFSVLSTTLARKISARRSASTLLSPAPTTLMIASSRSTASPSTVKSCTSCNGDDTTQLRLDLLDHLRRTGGDDGDTAQMPGVIDLGHGEAFDVVTTAREQPDHTGQEHPVRFRPEPRWCGVPATSEKVGRRL